MRNVGESRHHSRPNFRERVADVERLLAIDDPKPLSVKVSRTERILMELLLKRNMLTRAKWPGAFFTDTDQTLTDQITESSQR